jgi:hypothetical protein
MYLVFTNPVTQADIFLPHTITPAATITDGAGLVSAPAAVSVAEVALGVVEPVWASDGNQQTADDTFGTNTVRRFDGTEQLEPADITIQIYNSTSYPVQLMYDVQEQAVLPTSMVMEVMNPQPAAAVAVQGDLYTFVLPLSDITETAQVAFYLEVGGVETRRVVNKLDPKAVSYWTFAVQPVTRQRGGVTILNNVIDPALGEQVRVVYNVSATTTVMVLVADVRGRIVDVLFRGTRDTGEYYAEWDGRNRAGRRVAPGLYYIKVISRGVEEIRKVLVLRGSK